MVIHSSYTTNSNNHSSRNHTINLENPSKNKDNNNKTIIIANCN